MILFQIYLYTINDSMSLSFEGPKNARCSLKGIMYANFQISQYIEAQTSYAFSPCRKPHATTNHPCQTLFLSRCGVYFLPPTGVGLLLILLSSRPLSFNHLRVHMSNSRSSSALGSLR